MSVFEQLMNHISLAVKSRPQCVLRHPGNTAWVQSCAGSIPYFIASAEMHEQSKIEPHLPYKTGLYRCYTKSPNAQDVFNRFDLHVLRAQYYVYHSGFTASPRTYCMHAFNLMLDSKC